MLDGDRTELNAIRAELSNLRKYTVNSSVGQFPSSFGGNVNSNSNNSINQHALLNPLNNVNITSNSNNYNFDDEKNTSQ